MANSASLNKFFQSNADTLDGESSEYYLNYNNLINRPTIPTDVSDLTDTTSSIPSTLTDLTITDGSDGQVLTTDGSGGFTFTTIASASTPTLAQVTAAGATTSENVTFGGNLLVSGDLTISGTSTTVNTSNLAVDDSLIKLATGNESSDLVDIGFYGHYYNGSRAAHAGMFRDASDGKFKIFSDYGDGGDDDAATTIDTSDVNFTLGVVAAGSFEGDLTGDVTGNVSTASGNLQLDSATQIVEVRGDGSSIVGQVQLNCHVNSHGQIIASQPHSQAATNKLTLPGGTTIGNSDATLVSDTGTQTLTNKTITATNNTLSIAVQDLSDVTITSASENDYLQYDGSGFVNKTPVLFKTMCIDEDVNFSSFTEGTIFNTNPDINQGGFGVTSTEITVPEDGIYMCSFNFRLSSAIARVNVFASWGINNSNQGEYAASGYIRNSSGHDNSSLHYTTLFNLTANDTLSVFFQRESADGTTTLDGNTSTVSVVKVG